MKTKRLGKNRLSRVAKGKEQKKNSRLGGHRVTKRLLKSTQKNKAEAGIGLLYTSKKPRTITMGPL